MGQWGLGLLYAAFVWTLVPAVAALVDFVRLVAMTDERFAATHGRRPGGGAVAAAVVIVLWLVAAGIAGALLAPTLLAYAAALAGR
jgi:hypothetical protein